MKMHWKEKKIIYTRIYGEGGLLVDLLGIEKLVIGHLVESMEYCDHLIVII